jgi:hypothetical protein
MCFFMWSDIDKPLKWKFYRPASFILAYFLFYSAIMIKKIWIFWAFSILVLLAGCQKKCINGVGQYFVPMYVSVTPVPKVQLGKDTVKIKIWIPYETADLRFPEEKIDLRHRKPVKLHGGISHPPIRRVDVDSYKGGWNPNDTSYLKLIAIKGKRLLQAGDIAFEFAAGADAWEIEYGIVPTKPYEGVYFYYLSITQFKDRCVQIDPVTTLVKHTNQSSFGTRTI